VIESLVRSALKQRLIVAVVAAVLFFFGLDAARKLSVDAFPDVTNVQVQIATEAPGRSPEEVERFATVPLEVAMTGLPGLEEMRSLNKPGLSLITLVFSDKTDVYFARQLVMERLLEVGSRLPAGITPVLGPVSTGLGEVYQYTLERADDGDRALSEEELMKRRIAQDWVVRPLAALDSRGRRDQFAGRLRQAVPGAGQSRQAAPFRPEHRRCLSGVGRNNANAGGGVLPQYAEQYLIRGVGLVRDLEDLRAIVLKEVRTACRSMSATWPRSRSATRCARARDQERRPPSGRRRGHDDRRRQRQGGGQPDQGAGRPRSTPRACCPTA
jgi:cobalt-zinc-cadmium resistance protein CzcA